MCASVNRDEVYIFGEVMVRVEGQGFSYRLLNTPCSISSQKVSAQGIMESAICTLVAQFKLHAGKDGSSSTLSRGEFQNLVSSQLPNFVKNASDPEAIKELMRFLDENNDEELTFSEFWQLIGTLASKEGGF